MANFDRALKIAKPLIKGYEGLASSTPPCGTSWAAVKKCLNYLPKEGNPNDKVYAYWDIYAKLYTIGWGSIYYKKRMVQATDVITRAEAERIFEEEVIQKAKDLQKYVDFKKINDNQLAVLISMAYNAGVGGINRYTKVFQYIKENKPATVVAKNIRDTLTTSKGVTVPGLVRRRREESEFYLKPVVTALSPFFFLALAGLLAIFAFKKSK